MSWCRVRWKDGEEEEEEEGGRMEQPRASTVRNVSWAESLRERFIYST